MPFTVTMPKLSPTMEEGTVVKWHKREGDKVAAGELLLEVSTDKATVEYNALDEGILRKVLIPTGARAIVNQPIAIFTVKAGESIEGYEPEGTMPPSETTVEFKEERAKEMPTQGAAPLSMQQPAFTPEPPLEKYVFPFPNASREERAVASPLAKKMAKAKGLDITTVKGTGPRGRITSHDLDLAQPAQREVACRRETPKIAPGTYEEVPLSPMRQVIGKRLQQSKSFIPHFYVRQEINAGALVQIREQLKQGNIHFTMNDFIVRACALALREHPRVNSGFNSVTQSIIHFQTIDLAIAVSIDAGLITPIIRHADFKTIGELSSEIKELALRAKLNKLQPEEYKGGSFTISNLGMFGVSDFVAVINPPQAAILAISGIEECVRFENGACTAGKKMNLTLSADHRVIDGADAAKFLRSLLKLLENPAALLL